MSAGTFSQTELLQIAEQQRRWAAMIKANGPTRAQHKDQVMKDRIEDLAKGFEDVVEAYQRDRGMTRIAAIQSAAKKFPRMHKSYLVASNERAGRFQAVAVLRGEIERAV